MNKHDIIDYGKLVDEAMHVIVYKVMALIEKHGLPGTHHFFISFMTKHTAVKLSETLLNRYPKEMTIVLQYQFQDLKVDNKGFSITLSFNGTKENIYIPFAAITTFADPSVQFGLQFREAIYDQDDVNYHHDIALEYDTPATENKKSKKKQKSDEDNVVSLDAFRKAKKR